MKMALIAGQKVRCARTTKMAGFRMAKGWSKQQQQQQQQ
jgi:hypothetical protein